MWMSSPFLTFSNSLVTIGIKVIVREIDARAIYQHHYEMESQSEYDSGH